MVSFQRTTETTVLISEFIIYRLIKHETFASTNLDSYLFFLSLFVSSKRENSFYYRVHAFWLRSRCSTCFTLSDALLYYNVGKPTPYIYVVNSVTVTLTLWQHLSHRTNQLVRRIPMPDWHWWRGQCFFPWPIWQAYRYPKWNASCVTSCRLQTLGKYSVYIALYVWKCSICYLLCLVLSYYTKYRWCNSAWGSLQHSMNLIQ